MGMAAALIAATAGLAQAQEFEVLFAHKHWEVLIFGFDDGSVACEAKVAAPGESFSIWTYQDGTVQLQFYSTVWQFNDGDTADLEVEIDRRGPWRATADLTQNSVLLYLPDSQAGVNFINEVARGNRLYLRDADGSDVQNYSLAGSSASIDALIDCGGVIQTPGNPFN